uniref:Putative secreted protein n=1 Tax=Ixodes ricinus TaxID=34613 RepID=A0A6B0UFA6_IXORI
MPAPPRTGSRRRSFVARACWCTLVLRHRVSSEEANEDSGRLANATFSGGRSWAAILRADHIPFIPKLRLRWKLCPQWTSHTSLFRHVITLPLIHTRRNWVE